MADLTANQPRARQGDANAVLLPIQSAGVAASTHLFAGGMLGLNAAGYLVKASAAACVQIVGAARREYDNSSGADGALTAEYVSGAWSFAIGSGSDALTIANRTQDVFCIDDQTVGATDGGGTRKRAGYLLNVVGSRAFVMLGVANPLAIAEGAQPGAAPVRARGVVIANVAALATFTVANNGLTYVAGDVVLLTAQTTAAENGLYVVGVVAAGVAPLTRPAGWIAGDLIPQGYVVEVGDGNTLLAGSEWKALCGAGKIVGTDDPLFYPRNIHSTVTLVAGTKTLGSAQGLFLFSATASTVTALRNTANTTAATIMYAAPAASRVAGVSGTAAVLVRAAIADGSINVADISTMDVSIVNW